MWYRLKNLFFSLWHYNTLKPNFKVRRRVQRALRDRPRLAMNDWFESFGKTRRISYPIFSFLYSHLERYSGLALGQLLPSDRLEQDLQWTQICWFDWQTRLSLDFMQRFGIDVSESLDEADPSTVEELMLLLQHQVEG
jgi:hypothetical protein